MKTALKLMLCVVTLCVAAFVVTFNNAGGKAVCTSVNQGAFTTIDLPGSPVADLFSDVVCTPRTNTTNINHRISFQNRCVSPLYSPAELKGKINNQTQLPTDIAIANITSLCRPQSLYYIYTLHRIRI